MPRSARSKSPTMFLRSINAEHDNVNVVAMGHWIIGQKLAEEIVVAFINAVFEDNEDFHRRVAKLSELEEWGRNRS